LKGGFPARLVFLPSVLAIPDEVIEQSFRNASIDGGEVTSRVINVISSANGALPLLRRFRTYCCVASLGDQIG
jgi:hypothetical protein